MGYGNQGYNAPRQSYGQPSGGYGQQRPPKQTFMRDGFVDFMNPAMKRDGSGQFMKLGIAGIEMACFNLAILQDISVGTYVRAEISQSGKYHNLEGVQPMNPPDGVVFNPNAMAAQAPMQAPAPQQGAPASYQPASGQTWQSNNYWKAKHEFDKVENRQKNRSVALRYAIDSVHNNLADGILEVKDLGMDEEGKPQHVSKGYINELQKLADAFLEYITTPPQRQSPPPAPVQQGPPVMTPGQNIRTGQEVRMPSATPREASHNEEFSSADQY